MTDGLTRDDLPTFAGRAADAVGRRYGKYGVGREDAYQVIWEWIYRHPRRVDSWLEADPPKPTRLYFALLDAGVHFAEKEKANRAGYDVSDVAWYSPNMVIGLMPIVLEEDYDGLHGDSDSSGPSNSLASQGNDLLAKVADIRRAIYWLPDNVGNALRAHEPGVPAYDDAIHAVVDFLGGDRRSIGRRKVRSNASAQSITSRESS